MDEAEIYHLIDCDGAVGDDLVVSCTDCDHYVDARAFPERNLQWMSWDFGRDAGAWNLGKWKPKIECCARRRTFLVAHFEIIR